MRAMPPQPFSFYINLAIAILSFYAAWVNLVHKKISRFGFDAFLLLFGRLLDANQVKKIRKDPKLIQRMGIIMLLFGTGAIYAAVLRFFELYR